MNFSLCKTSDHWKTPKETVVIESVEDLKNLQEKHGKYDPLIIDFILGTIEVYDDYRE